MLRSGVANLFLASFFVLAADADAKDRSIATASQISDSSRSEKPKKGQPDQHKTDRDLTWVFSKPAGIEFTKTEVTVAQYRACVETGKCSKPISKSENDHCNWGYADRDSHPVNCVDWNQADAFCDWIGGRLPTEGEWQAEASNNGARKYPWGDQKPTCDYTVMNSGGEGCKKASTWPVCSKERGNSVSGLCDMSGNVWEWTSTSDGPSRAVLGGSWHYYGTDLLQASLRAWSDALAKNYHSGIRCGRSPATGP